jgi:hypothetical protein
MEMVIGTSTGVGTMDGPFTGYKVKGYDIEGSVAITARYDSANDAMTQAEYWHSVGTLNIEGKGWTSLGCVSIFSCQEGICRDIADYEL